MDKSGKDFASSTYWTVETEKSITNEYYCLIFWLKCIYSRMFMVNLFENVSMMKLIKWKFQNAKLAICCSGNVPFTSFPDSDGKTIHKFTRKCGNQREKYQPILFSIRNVSFKYLSKDRAIHLSRWKSSFGLTHSSNWIFGEERRRINFRRSHRASQSASEFSFRSLKNYFSLRETSTFPPYIYLYLIVNARVSEHSFVAAALNGKSTRVSFLLRENSFSGLEMERGVADSKMSETNGPSRMMCMVTSPFFWLNY